MKRQDWLRMGLVVVLAAACGTPVEPNLPADTTPPAVTANPSGGSFEAEVNVMLAANEAATVKYTTDGSDPKTSATAQQGASPVNVTIPALATTELRFFGTDSAGNASDAKLETYVVQEPATPAAILGTVHFHSALASAGAVGAVALWDKDPSGGGDPGAPKAYVALTPGADVRFKLEGLAAGKYWLAALWWPHQPVNNEGPEAFALAGRNPIEVDPAVDGKKRVEGVELFVGTCDPAGTGVQGTVKLGAPVAGLAVQVVALPAPVRTGEDPQPLAIATAFGTGSERAYALCGLSGQVYLYGTSGVGGGANDPAYVIAMPSNPLQVTKVETLPLWIGTGEPGTAAVSGHVTPSASVEGVEVQVWVTSEPFSGGAVEVIGLQSLKLNGVAAVEFDLAPVTNGTYYVTASVKDGASHQTFVTSNDPFVAGPPSPSAPLSLALPVGTISGTLEVTGYASAGKAAVFAVPHGAPGGTPPVAVTELVLPAPDAAGHRSVDFALFGVGEGSFDVSAVLDADGDGSLADNVMTGPVQPAGEISVSGGVGAGAICTFVEPS